MIRTCGKMPTQKRAILSSPRYLSKSRYLSGLQCSKRLWLEINSTDIEPIEDPSQQRALEEGNAIGAYARTFFPGGLVIEREGGQMVDRTRRAIERGVSVLFEAAFFYEGIYVQCDILRRRKEGGWDIIEVKASTKPKPEHVHDLAIQRYVAEGSGLTVQSTLLMHIDNERCTYPHLSRLFRFHDLSVRVERTINDLEDSLERTWLTLEEKEEPGIPIGGHCSSPTPCPYVEYCWRDVSKHSIFSIPRLSSSAKDELLAAGYANVSDLPADYPLTPEQRAYYRAVTEGVAQIRYTAIRNKLSLLTYPIYFLDFEAFNPAIPLYDGLRPFEQFPFQYSLHILDRDGNLSHRDYLHTEPTDPRPGLLKALLNDIGEDGSIVAYYAGFEKGILQRLADSYPEHAARLRSFCDRLWDQWLIFRSDYIDPEFCGSSSIKKVLPVLAPELSYDMLPVKRGDQAQSVWYEMIRCGNEEEKWRMAEDLRAYCRTDTLAMVKIHLALLQRCAEENEPV